MEASALKGKTVLVVGSGISGIGAVEALQYVGAAPLLFDENEKLTIEEVQAKLKPESHTEIVIGTLSEEQKAAVELVVLSPGVPTDTAFVEEFRSRGVKIWGEIELAYEIGKGSVIAITGTNGKTTTTTLVGEIMKAFCEYVDVVGNIGNPYTVTATVSRQETVTVAEVSSFQLETIERFRPQVSAILNITPDHLNRHHTMENYAAAKEAVCKNQTKAEVCVLNYENEYTRAFGARCPATVVWFSSKRRLADGFYLEGEEIFRAKDGKSTRLMNMREMRLKGICNVENVMAAMAVTQAMGVPMETILTVIRDFAPVEHRIEFVAAKRGIDFYNDSKGTNPDAAIQGIRAMDRPTVLLGGGYDKQSEYDAWIEAFDGKVRCLVLIGQTREKIADCARRHGMSDIVLADSFEEAFEICVERAKPGDAVLLSPACASWGMFPNYEVRGRRFKELVEQMEENV
ncbi:MAG: UDP-N-acetylmuramoyl-L-alanine--D-glutamate ligase [Bacteroidales bacterium]|nr:UDP-N-acetylmuramoyl-L-alanine--D-glutamate ligase [Bacteroidales bacterium]MCM1416302.1 UDP-N-acetylmuramoyl-L-alanine--D-glutamate ligase [bacterium]MCM1424238.1 UDP-N-acetylmuramoyl-L-alanine--D-glutamate ligase [bacterium]